MVWEFLNIAEFFLIHPVSFIAILYPSLNDVCTMECILHIERRYGRKHLPLLLLYLHCYVIIILLSSFSWRHLRWDCISTSRTSLLAFYALSEIFFVLFLFSLAIYFIYRLHGFFFYRSIFSPFFFLHLCSTSILYINGVKWNHISWSFGLWARCGVSHFFYLVGSAFDGLKAGCAGGNVRHK